MACHIHGESIVYKKSVRSNREGRRKYVVFRELGRTDKEVGEEEGAGRDTKDTRGECTEGGERKCGKTELTGDWGWSVWITWTGTRIDRKREGKAALRAIVRTEVARKGRLCRWGHG
jgi:hypothetical protein